ncbi:hypothetical protein B8W55_21175, partial [Cronobacter sakazakii]
MRCAFPPYASGLEGGRRAHPPARVAFLPNPQLICALAQGLPGPPPPPPPPPPLSAAGILP